jgi:hypothetical protein
MVQLWTFVKTVMDLKIYKTGSLPVTSVAGSLARKSLHIEMH